MKIIGYIHSGYKSKFGIPRQSGFVASTIGKIIMESEFKDRDFFREIESFSHLWIIRGF